MIALFRIQEMSAGQILVDGIDTATVPLRILRSKLGIIPQDPVIFSASVRFNLDPFDEYTDGMIWDALTSVDMKVRREVLVIFIATVINVIMTIIIIIIIVVFILIAITISVFNFIIIMGKGILLP